MTVAAAPTVTVQAPAPAQAPLQPPKVEPASGVAVSVNWAPGATASLQSAPQAMPAGALETVPEPAPLRLTVSVTGISVNVAVTVVPALTVTVQSPVPVQAPLQPANVEPAAGVAVSVNAVPGSNGLGAVGAAGDAGGGAGDGAGPGAAPGHDEGDGRAG